MSFNIIPVFSEYQEIHPYGVVNIDSVKIKMMSAKYSSILTVSRGICIIVIQKTALSLSISCHPTYVELQAQ